MAGTYGTSTFADSEFQTFFHGDRLDQGNGQAGVSPGITISVPAFRVTSPVTSVVRK